MKRSDVIAEMSRWFQTEVGLHPQRAWTICSELLRVAEDTGMRPTTVSGGITKYLVVTDYELEEPRSGAV